MLAGLFGAAWWPGRWAGGAPGCWPWSASASAPTCAPPPSTTCCLSPRLLRQQAHRRPDVAHRQRVRPHLRVPLHALDFATDVLMIGMTAVILFNINPWLALVTLLPLPFIAWMIHPGCATACAPASRRSTASGARSPACWPTPFPASARQGLRAGEGEAERFRSANRHNLEVNDRLNKTWSPVLAHRLAAHRDRPAGGVGLRHLAGGRTASRSAC